MGWLLLTISLLVLFFGLVVFSGAPYVPSRKKDVQQAFSRLYPLGPDDLLVDIGSGDGLVLRAAAKIGARAVGYEINPILVFVSRLLARKYRGIDVILADFWLSKLPTDVTVVYIFSVTRDMKKIINKLQNETNRLGRPIHVISYGSKFDVVKAIKSLGAYNLYRLEPLQSAEAQV